MTTHSGANGRHLVPVLLLLVVVTLVYLNSFEGSFHSDDYTVIQSNPQIGDPGIFWHFPPHYRQWLTASFALNFAQGGLNPWGYHFVNLVLHGLTACFLMALIRLTLAQGWNLQSSQSNRVAFFAGTLFVLHPVHTETVTYISGRGNGLSALLYLGALLFFATSQLKKSSPIKKTWAIFLTFLFSFGALLSKEISITLPLGLLLYDLLFMRGPDWESRVLRMKWVYGPIITGAVLMLTLSTTFKIQAAHWLERIDWSRIPDQLPVLAHGLKLILLPFNLTFDYDFPKTSFLSGPFWLTSLALWITLLATAWQKRRQSPPVFTFALLWFLIILSPTNSILPRIDLLSERNLYLPSIGFCWWGGMAINNLLEKKAAFRMATLMTIAFLTISLLFGLLTYSRNRVYKSDISLWKDTLKKSPNKSEVHYYLAMAHYLAGDTAGSRRELERLTQKDPELVQRIKATPEESRQQLEAYLQLLDGLKQVVQSDPDRYKIYGQVYQELAGLFRTDTSLYFTRLLLGARLAEEGKFNLAEVEFRKALAARPHLPQAHLDLAALLARKGLNGQAFDETEIAENKMHLAPDLLPRWHLIRARILLGHKNLESAQKEAEQTLASDASNSEAHFLLGEIEMAQGQTEQAISQWQQVAAPLSLKSEARFKIAMAEVKLGRFDDARESLTQTLELTPGNGAARFNLAKLILEHGGDPNQARHHLKALMNTTTDTTKRQMIEQLISRIPREQ